MGYDGWPDKPRLPVATDLQEKEVMKDQLAPRPVSAKEWGAVTIRQALNEAIDNVHTRLAELERLKAQLPLAVLSMTRTEASQLTKL